MKKEKKKSYPHRPLPRGQKEEKEGERNDLYKFNIAQEGGKRGGEGEKPPRPWGKEGGGTSLSSLIRRRWIGGEEQRTRAWYYHVFTGER